MTATDSNIRAGAVALLRHATLLPLALMGCLPFLLWHHRGPIPSFAGEWLAVTLGLLAAMPLLERRHWQPLPFPPIALVPLGLVLVAVVQVASGHVASWQQHMLVALYLAWAALMMVLGGVLKHQAGMERAVPAIAWGVLAGGVLNAGIVGLQAAGLDAFPPIGPRVVTRYGANLVPASQLAGYLALGLGSLLYLYATSRIRSRLAVPAALALLLPLALGGTRMGWIYVFMLAAGFWLAGRHGTHPGWQRKTARGLWLIPAFVAIQTALSLLPVADAPLAPWQQMAGVMQEADMRLQLAREAWHIFLAHPWLGSGFGQFGWQDLLLAQSFPGHTGYTPHPGNLLLHLLAETGLAGTLIVLAGGGYWLRNGRRSPLNPERWWLLALLAVLATYSLTDAPLWAAYFLGPTALLLGLGEEKSLDCKLDLGPLMAGSVIAFGVLSLGNIGAHYGRLANQVRQMPEIRKDKAKFGIVLENLSAIRRKSLLAPYADQELARLLPSNDPQLSAGLLAINEQVVRFMPESGAVYRQALLLALSGEKDQALRQLQLAIIRHPQGLYDFSMRLTRMIGPQTMPLLNEIVRHNRAEMGMPAIPEHKLAP